MKDVQFLLVEDNEIDVMAFVRGLKRQRIANPLIVAGNGVEALQILRGEHPDKVIERPFMIFLDMNMPMMNGIEFLEELRQDEELCASVVFVLSTSDHHSDLFAAYKNNVAGYILKQDLGDACSNLHEMISSYGRIVVLP